jgi:hypothetical protein
MTAERDRLVILCTRAAVRPRLTVSADARGVHVYKIGADDAIRDSETAYLRRSRHHAMSVRYTSLIGNGT